MYIKTIKLENVKGFKQLLFDFERPDGTFPGWTVLVGGNASGKSTLLKAISLALIGPDAGRQLLVSPAGWLSPNQSRAEVLAEISWDKSPFAACAPHNMADRATVAKPAKTNFFVIDESSN